MPIFTTRQRQIVSPLAADGLAAGLVFATFAGDHRGLDRINRVDGQTAQRFGTPTLDGYTDYGYSIDGNASGYWAVPATNFNTGPVTFFFRARVEYTAAATVLLSIGNSSADGTPRLLIVNNAGGLRVYWNQGYKIDTASVFAVGDNISTSLVIGGSAGQVYLNGLPFGSASTNTFAVNNGNTLYIGSGFQGVSTDEIYEVFVWNRELSAMEMLAVHADSSQLCVRPSMNWLLRPSSSVFSQAWARSNAVVSSGARVV